MFKVCLTRFWSLAEASKRFTAVGLDPSRYCNRPTIYVTDSSALRKRSSERLWSSTTKERAATMAIAGAPLTVIVLMA